MVEHSITWPNWPKQTFGFLGKNIFLTPPPLTHCAFSGGTIILAEEWATIKKSRLVDVCEGIILWGCLQPVWQCTPWRWSFQEMLHLYLVMLCLILMALLSLRASGRDDATLYLLFLPQQKYCRHGPSAKNHPEIFLLPKVSTLSTTPSMLSMSTMLTMSINANTVLTLCNVGALCNNSLLHVPAQGKHRKNCESCPHKLPGKSSLNNGSVRPVCPLGSL